MLRHWLADVERERPLAPDGESDSRAVGYRRIPAATAESLTGIMAYRQSRPSPLEPQQAIKRVEPRSLIWPGLKVAVDVGGTFVDVLAIDESGALRWRKVPNAAGDLSSAVGAAIREML